MKFRDFRHSLAYVASLSCFAHLSVYAQSAQDPYTTRLDDVTITARSLENTGLLVPAQQLSGAALTQRLGSTLGETLDNLPGIANSSFGPNVGRPTIRGMDGDRIRILQNSGANMDVSGLSFDHAVPMDPLTTERIEILRGPATLLYGGSAIGGVVNVIDNRIARERAFDSKGGVMGKAELRAGGAANERSTGAMVETGTDKFAIHVDAFDRRTQNLKVPKNMSCESGVNSVKVCNSASNTKGGAVGGTLLFDRGYLGLSTSEYKSTYGTVAEEYVTIGMVRRHHALEGKLRDVGEWFQDVKFQGGYTQYSHTEYSSNVAGTQFDNGGLDMRLEARQRSVALGNGLQLEGTIGLQSERNNLHAVGDEKFVPTSRTHSTALFTYQALKTPWGQWTAGARSESVSVQSLESIGPNNENAAQTKTFNPMSFALGVMRNLRQGEAQNGWQVTSNITTSQRAPKDYELFAYGPHAATGAYEIGSSTMALEKATQLDLGGEWKNGLHKLGVTAFTSEFANFISLQSSGSYKTSAGAVGTSTDLPVYNFQGVRARFMGLESHAKLRMVGGQQALLSNDAQHGAVDLELRGDILRADDLTNGRPMPRIAPMRLGADALWSKNAWGARFGFMHAGAQNRMPYYSNVTPVTTAAYTLWNAGLNYHAHSGPTHWMFFAKLDNLTNKLAYSSTSSLTQTMSSSLAPPLAGRSLKLGLQASF
ncbi:MAG: TonB-dependent receptor [Betaproteobacteria bacterium]|nr:TonB-dependent receptor [Betaproteobacteria bacterium]